MLRSVEESLFQTKVMALCREMKLHVHHCSLHRGPQAGFPDLVVIGRGGVLWRELKSEYGILKSEQRALGYTLLASGQDWRVWKPSDWDILKEELEWIL